jgi:hypothetical protein
MGVFGNRVTNLFAIKKEVIILNYELILMFN